MSKLLLIIFLVLGLSGCGGGGDSADTDETAADTAVFDMASFDDGTVFIQ